MRPPDIDHRIESARALYRRCTACAWRCGVDRLAGELGRCGLDARARLEREVVSAGEEAGLSPSHLVYLSGCSFRCAFCLSGSMVDTPDRAPPLDASALVSLSTLAERRRREGARNLNVLGGDPSVNVLAVLELAARIPADHPIVYNSNFYHTAEVFELLDGVVDVWLPDLKFGNDACAERIAKVPRYLDVVTRNLLTVHATGARMIVRHLVMPGHVACCSAPVAQFLVEQMPDVEVSLMADFLPLHRADRHPELVRVEDWNGEEEARRLATRYGLRLAAPPGVEESVPPLAGAGGYAGSLFFDRDGRVSLLDPSSGLMKIGRRLGRAAEDP